MGRYYGGYGLGYRSYGYYGKRDADAEPEAKAGADPYYYGGYYGRGYGYGIGYRRYYGGYGLGYRSYGYYGKREADAEPEAKADADPYYYGGYYGHGYGYGIGYRRYYGGYGLGYRRYGYYGKRDADAEP